MCQSAEQSEGCPTNNENCVQPNFKIRHAKQGEHCML